MIVKEMDPFGGGDTLAAAGRRAEEQMAFYLRRAFEKDDALRIFHGLRLEQGGDAAQIDHLVLHRFGMIIIESKSVSSRVRINEHGEWSRLALGHWKGMPSPILQAERQGEFLRARLQENQESLRDKFLLGLRQGGFLSMPIDILVAISDEAIIERDGVSPPQVCKAEKVASRVAEIYEGYAAALKKATRSINPNADFPYEFKKDEMPRITYFLNESHRPLPAPPPPSVAAPEVPPALAEPAVAPSAAPVCAVCAVPLTEKVTQYCRENPDRFEGKLYCFTHQRQSRSRRTAEKTGDS